MEDVCVYMYVRDVYYLKIKLVYLEKRFFGTFFSFFVIQTKGSKFIFLIIHIVLI